MRPSTLFERITGWMAGLPIAFAYRIVWFMAIIGTNIGRQVYRAMWDAHLNLPPLSQGGKK